LGSPRVLGDSQGEIKKKEGKKKNFSPQKPPKHFFPPSSTKASSVTIFWTEGSTGNEFHALFSDVYLFSAAALLRPLPLEVEPFPFLLLEDITTL
jgi:hypothetical protein